MSLRSVGATLPSKLTIETYLQEIVSKAGRSLADVRRAVKLFDFHACSYPMNEYLKHFVATRNTRASSALGELHLVTSRIRTESIRSVVSDC